MSEMTYIVNITCVQTYESSLVYNLEHHIIMPMKLRSIKRIDLKPALSLTSYLG